MSWVFLPSSVSFSFYVKLTKQIVSVAETETTNEQSTDFVEVINIPIKSCHFQTLNENWTLVEVCSPIVELHFNDMI